jgi:hypothetical protein
VIPVWRDYHNFGDFRQRFGEHVNASGEVAVVIAYKDLQVTNSLLRITGSSPPVRH